MAAIPEGVILARGVSTDGVSPNFYYLTGIDEPRGALLLAAGGVRVGTGRKYPGPDYVRGRIVKQILFLPAPDPLAARWGEDGKATLGSMEPQAGGFEEILGLDELNEVLVEALRSAGSFHYVRCGPATLSASGNSDAEFVENVRRNFFGTAVRDATAEVEEMRRLKDAGEVRSIERSIEVTRQAVLRAISTARAGMHEYEIEAELAGVYRSHGGAHAFAPIVAAGPNAVLLHYKENTGRIEPGQLVLIDTGVSIDGYKADITRTFPIDGRFTERQRQVYEAVLHAQDAAIALCKPGALLADIHARTYESIEGDGFAEHFVHGTGHHLGLETHDVGDVHRPLEPGVVITIEPGIYLTDEEIGVRIEDDVLITEDGHRVLSAAIPREVEEIESVLAGD